MSTRVEEHTVMCVYPTWYMGLAAARLVPDFILPPSLCTGVALCARGYGERCGCIRVVTAGPIAAEDEQVRGQRAWAIALPTMLSTPLEPADKGVVRSDCC